MGRERSSEVEADIIDVDPGGAGDAPRPSDDAGGHSSEDFWNGGVFKRLNIEVDPDAVDESVQRIVDQIKRGVVRGRYTKVRIKFKGKPLVRDIPLSVFVAAEAVSFVYVGLLKALVVNLGARAVIDVELIYEADEDVAEGRAQWEAGEVQAAERAYRAALAKEPKHTEALYRLGVLLRVTGQRDEAIQRLEAAAAAEGPMADLAREALDRMKRGPRTL